MKNTILISAALVIIAFGVGTAGGIAIERHSAQSEYRLLGITHQMMSTVLSTVCLNLLKAGNTDKAIEILEMNLRMSVKRVDEDLRQSDIFAAPIPHLKEGMRRAKAYAKNHTLDSNVEDACTRILQKLED